MTFGHYDSPLTLAEASFSDLELFVFFVILAGVMIWLHLRCEWASWSQAGRLSISGSCRGAWKVKYTQNWAENPPRPPLEPQALEDDRHCSLDLQLQITRSNKTWPHVTFVYCVSAFTLAKASFVWLGMFTTWLPLRFKIHPTKRLKKRAARTEIASTPFWMSGASIGVRGLLDTTQPTVKMCDK